MVVPPVWPGEDRLARAQVVNEFAKIEGQVVGHQQRRGLAVFRVGSVHLHLRRSSVEVERLRADDPDLGEPQPGRDREPVAYGPHGPGHLSVDGTVVGSINQPSKLLKPEVRRSCRRSSLGLNRVAPASGSSGTRRDHIGIITCSHLLDCWPRTRPGAAVMESPGFPSGSFQCRSPPSQLPETTAEPSGETASEPTQSSCRSSTAA